MKTSLVPVEIPKSKVSQCWQTRTDPEETAVGCNYCVDGDCWLGISLLTSGKSDGRGFLTQIPLTCPIGQISEEIASSLVFDIDLVSQSEEKEIDELIAEAKKLRGSSI